LPQIRRLLIANRGEIATRIARTARTLDMVTVGVFSEPDSGAPFVDAMDEAVPLGGAAPADTYLDIGKIIGAARRSGADAVHPGYGFLSESAAFARACAAAGIVLVGPPPEVIEAMGSKLAAKQLVAAAGVPVLPGVAVGPGSDGGGDLAGRVASEVGYPALVKAAFGGGGRGMRMVSEPRALPEAVAASRREAESAFGDGTVFVEHYVDAPRHVEVQIVGDHHGNFVHLFERECSIQRRYQKIIEEAPSPAVDTDLREAITAAAVTAAKAIGYVNAGTVEFVLDAGGRFYFLEVNTRLQVEHPVTEMITGLDLVALQLAVAEGQPLPNEVFAATIHGHAVEARLYAEDVDAGFRPATGTVQTFSVPSLPGLRVDAGVAAGTSVGPHYDSMLAKVVAHAPTRAQACRTLARALAETRLQGVATNRELLLGVLRHDDFRAGRFDTAFLDRHPPAALAATARHPDSVALSALAVALADQSLRRRRAPVLATIPSGWRNVANRPQQVTYRAGDAGVTVCYRVVGPGTGPSDVEAGVGDRRFAGIRLRSAHDDAVVMEVDGVRRRFTIARHDAGRYVHSSLGDVTLHEQPRFPEPESQAQPGSLLAPMPGTVVRVGAAVGDTVAPGETIVVMEAMKMEHAISAPHAGTVTSVAVEVGQVVDMGTVVAVVATPQTPAGARQ
jgi:propionyl-CoA carboxylase alpha chain